MKAPILSLLLLLSSLPLVAQNGDRGDDLYVPPDLTIALAHDMSWLSRLYGAEVEAINPTEKQLHIQQERSDHNSLVPLPVLFFDQASSVIPERYQTFHRSLDADDYREEQAIDVTYDFSGRRFAKYLEILNIIGSRMSRNEGVTVDIMGAYSSEPGETPEIARERSDVIVEYLRNVWRIDSSRLTVLPARRLADSSDNILAQEEARSVRIYPSDPVLLQKVYYSTVEFQMQPLTIAIGLSPNMPRREIASAHLVIASGDDILGETKLVIPEGDEGMPIRWTGLWFLPRRINDIQEPLSFNLLLGSDRGIVRPSNTVTVPMVIDKPEREEYEYSAGLSTETEVRYDGSGEIRAERSYSDRDLDYVDGEVIFFDHGDTLLNPLNRLFMREAISRLDTILGSRDGLAWHLVAAVDGDFSENPEVEDATLRTGQSIYETSTQFGQSFFTDPEFKVSLYIFPELDELPEEAPDEFLLNDMIEQMYGDRARELKRLQQESRKIYDGSYAFGREAPLFDSLLVARGRGFINYLFDHIDTSRIDSLIVKPADRYTTTVDWLPEERVYSRLVTWRLYRTDNPGWQDELDDEETDFTPDFEYEIHEDESEVEIEVREDIEDAAEEVEDEVDDEDDE